MKKVLLIGELNQTLSSVNKHLSARFHMQICEDTLNQVKGMLTVFKPDMAVICLAGIGRLDNRILDLFRDQYVNIPVMLIGMEEECRAYFQYYENKQFDFLTRPTTLAKLMKKCVDMLRMAGNIGKDSELGEASAAQTGGSDAKEQEMKRVETDRINEPEKKKILAVDDSGVLLRSVKTMLNTKYDLKLATSGMMALKQARKDIPDLILLDYEMPEWDGKKTLEEIRKDEELKDIPVVFLTGVADKSHIAAVLGLNPSGYLLKPIDQQKLIDTIDRVLTGTV